MVEDQEALQSTSEDNQKETEEKLEKLAGTLKDIQ
jgi:hypothetical protein